ncbi:hypothetical protein chiPu_0024351 [Chiloscyllium punctatum]|uniref:Cyclin-dependent kinases regulatory subunit n=1 Tax=Chiloscyllium punctatum TaxID=137246 RepID=A0A401TBL1_CHIPU|nr:hypothetical protein [Chiloscyllium punctatum]
MSGKVAMIRVRVSNQVVGWGIFIPRSELSCGSAPEIEYSALGILILFFLAHLSSPSHVMLPKKIAKLVPKTHLMSETEWRNLGVQQSPGWIHYMIHEPASAALTFSDRCTAKG